VSPMQFWSLASLETAPDAIAADIRDQLGNTPVDHDLVLAFVRPPDGVLAEEIFRAVRRAVPSRRFVACTAESVVAMGREIEAQAATAVMVADLPDVTIDLLPPLAADSSVLPTALTSLTVEPESIVLPDDVEAFIVLLDPFSVAADALLARLSELAPGVPVIGGIASWATSAGGNRLAQDDAISNAGLVGVMLRGDLDVSVIVSQGCRPVGAPFPVTASSGNMIRELDGRPPVEVLRDVFERADGDTQALMRSGVLIGRGISRDLDDLGRGGYLIRTMLGADSESGAVAVQDHIEEGELIQFHVRDATAAQEDLEMLLTSQAFEDAAAGALLFTCNGRGTAFYGRPDGDIAVVRNALGDEVPVAGFFCAGELGPIGGANFSHAYTASMAIFRPKH
jgi:small ligand-binding sensory domain FIST